MVDAFSSIISMGSCDFFFLAIPSIFFSAVFCLLASFCMFSSLNTECHGLGWGNLFWQESILHTRPCEFWGSGGKYAIYQKQIFCVSYFFPPLVRQLNYKHLIQEYPLEESLTYWMCLEVKYCLCLNQYILENLKCET